MAFDFIIETPGRRSINRNNNKIIQKRATQAGARTRSEKKAASRPFESSPPFPSGRLSVRSEPDSLASSTLYTNATLSAAYNFPFLARFGDYGRILYAQDTSSASNGTCFRLQNATLSFVQKYLLGTSHVQPRAHDANRMFKIMTLTQRDFLLHLCSHYGYVGFLDEAIECIVARLHESIPLLRQDHCSPTLPDTLTTYSYGRALQGLRTAIDDNLSHNLPCIWFAIMLLTLFELLSTTDESGWIWHVAGSSRILLQLGSDNLVSDFHLSLLASQSRIMAIEAIFSSKPCYLAEPRWQEAIYRTVFECDDFRERSRTSTELIAICARVPNLFQSITDSIQNPYDSKTKRTKRAAERIRSDLGTWARHWRDILELTCRNRLSDSTLRHQALMILLKYYMLLAIVCRLLVAISPSCAMVVEDGAISACIGVLSLQRNLMSCRTTSHSTGSIYCRVAAGTHATTSIWRNAIEKTLPGQMIAADIFCQWCNLIKGPTQSLPGDILSYQASIQ